jgi:hypothetical protein
MDTGHAAMDQVDTWIRPDIAVTGVQATECAPAPPQEVVDTVACGPANRLHLGIRSTVKKRRPEKNEFRAAKGIWPASYRRNGPVFCRKPVRRRTTTIIDYP